MGFLIADASLGHRVGGDQEAVAEDADGLPVVLHADGLGDIILWHRISGSVVVDELGLGHLEAVRPAFVLLDDPARRKRVQMFFFFGEEQLRRDARHGVGLLVRVRREPLDEGDYVLLGGYLAVVGIEPFDVLVGGLVLAFGLRAPRPAEEEPHPDVLRELRHRGMDLPPVGEDGDEGGHVVRHHRPRLRAEPL